MRDRSRARHHRPVTVYSPACVCGGGTRSFAIVGLHYIHTWRLLSNRLNRRVCRPLPPACPPRGAATRGPAPPSLSPRYPSACDRAKTLPPFNAGRPWRWSSSLTAVDARPPTHQMAASPLRRRSPHAFRLPNPSLAPAAHAPSAPGEDRTSRCGAGPAASPAQVGRRGGHRHRVGTGYGTADRAAEGVRCILGEVEQVRAIVHLSGAPPLGQLGQCRGLARRSLQHERPHSRL